MKAGKASLNVVAVALAIGSAYAYSWMRSEENKLFHGTNWNEPWKVTYAPQETPKGWVRDTTITEGFERLQCSSVEEDRKLAQWTPYRMKPGKFIEYRVVLPANECSDAVTIRYHLNLSQGRERAAVAIHPIGSGYGPIEQVISDYFTSHGFDAFSVERPKSNMRSIAAHMNDHETIIPLVNSGIEKAFTQHLRAIEYISSLPHINKDCLCNYGTSLGGIIAINLAAAMPDRFVANGVSLVGHTGSLLESKNAQSIDFVAKAVAHHPKGLSGLSQALNDGITFQPEDNARGVDPGRMVMITAKNDEIFSKESADRLRELMGNPKTYYFENGHASSAIWNMAQVHVAVGNYFGKKLAESAQCSHLAPSLRPLGNDLQQIADSGGIWATLSYLIQNGVPIVIERNYTESADMFRALSSGWIDSTTRLKGEPMRFSGQEDASAFISALIGSRQQLSQRTK